MVQVEEWVGKSVFSVVYTGQSAWEGVFVLGNIIIIYFSKIIEVLLLVPAFLGACCAQSK